MDISVFRSRFIDKNEKQIQTLVEIYQDHNDQFEKLTEGQYSCGTFKNLSLPFVSLKKFIQWKYKKPDVSLNEINHQFIKDYEFSVKAIQGVQHNSRHGQYQKTKEDRS